MKKALSFTLDLIRSRLSAISDNRSVDYTPPPVKTRLIALSAALLAAAAFLAACGEGNVIDPSAGNERNTIGDNLAALEEAIINGEISAISSSSDDPAESSSSDEPGSSSSSEQELSSSSAAAGSSSSLPPQSSSSNVPSSSSSKPSSSSAASTLPGGFDCKWDNGDNPSVMAGDVIKPDSTLANESDWTAKNCGEVTYKTNSGDYSAIVACDQPSLYNTPVPAEGIQAVDGKKHGLCAYFTCGGTQYDKKCPAAEVGAAPPYAPAPTVTCSYEIKAYPYEGDFEPSAEITNITTGDSARVRFEVTGEAENCSNPVFGGATANNSKIFDGAASGEYSISNALAGTINANSVKLKLSCSKPRYKDSTFTLNCPTTALTVTTVPAPSSSSVTLTCPAGWDLPGNAGKIPIGLDVSEGCTPGGTISNSEAATCGDISYESEGSTDAAGTFTAKAVATCRGKKYTLKEKAYTVVADPQLKSCAMESGKPYKGQTLIYKATIENNFGRCEAIYSDGTNTFGEEGRLLTEADVENTLTVTANAECGDYTYLFDNVPCGSLDIGNGLEGGGVDTPIEFPNGGGGTLPDPDQLKELDGVLYLSGKGRTNENWVQCQNKNGSSWAVHYCDFYDGDCEATNICTPGSDNIRCQASSIEFHAPAGNTDSNLCNNTQQCEYKLKLKFTIKQGDSYPSGCKLGT